MTKSLRIFHFRMNHLYLRMLLYFLSLLLPIIIVGVIVYFQNAQIQKNQLMEKVSSSLSFSAKTIDTYLHIAETAETNFVQSSIVQRNLRPTDQLTDFTRENISSIVQELSFDRAMGSSFIDEMFVYLDNRLIYRSDGVESFSDFFEKFNRFDQYNMAYWESMLHSDKAFTVQAPAQVQKTFYNNKITVIPLVTVQYVNGRKTVVVADISAKAILQTLTNNTVYGSTQFMALDQDGELMVSSPGVTFTHAPEQIRLVKEQFAEPTAKFAQLELGGVPYIVTKTTSATYGWQYYSFTPVHEYRKQVTGILSMTVWLCVILLVIGVVFSFLFSRNLYNPIKNIRDILLQQDQLRDTSHNNEFELIGKGIRKLLDNQTKLARFSYEFLDRSLSALIHGQHPEDMAALQTALQELEFSEGQYQCLAIQFKFNESFYEDFQEVDRLVILEKIKKVVWVILRQELPTYLMEYRHSLYIGVVNTRNSQDIERLQQALDMIIQTFGCDLQYCRLFIGIGRPKKLDELAKSYNEAMTAVAQRNPDKSFEIIDAAGLEVDNNYYYLLADEQRVINCLKVGDPELLEKTVADIVAVNQRKGVSHRYMGILFMELYHTANKFLAEKDQNAGLYLSEEEQELLTHRIDFPFEFEERQRLLLDFFKRIMQLTVQKEESKGGQLIPTILDYIHSNYNKDLYLEQIADEMGLSAKYVSKVFKERTGTNLTDYISTVRIREAKALLMETDMKIMEIGERIGIPSRATFFRLFKKSEGVSPYDYRKASQG